MKRTNIMLSDTQHRLLKQKALKEHKTLGELVRDAINIRYERDRVEQRRTVALEAYREGFISLGKLSEILGMDQTSIRQYLKEKIVPLKTQGVEDILQDAIHA